MAMDVIDTPLLMATGCATKRGLDFKTTHTSDSQHLHCAIHGKQNGQGDDVPVYVEEKYIAPDRRQGG